MIVLDTHAWIWFVDAPEKLGAKAMKAILATRKAGEPLRVSAISVWEIYMLCVKGRLQLSVAPDIWVSRCERLEELRFVPVDNTIARLSVDQCGTLHADPADRIIVATTLYLGAHLITCDERIKTSRLVPCIW